MSTQVSEQQARQVAEAAREQEWKLPELRQGAVPRQLPARPDPPAAAAARPRRSRRASASCEELRAFLTESVDPLQIERDSKIPDEAIEGLKRLGALGMKVPERVRRARALAGLLQQGARAGRQLALLAGHAALRPPVDRRRRAADAVRLRGAEAQVAAAGRQGPHLRLPADRARRRLRPGAPGLDRHADRGRLRPQRPQAVGDQRRDRRHRRRDGAGARSPTATGAASAPSSSTTRARA